MSSPSISFNPARADEFEELLALRIDAMRESLERVGRFDLERTRERFRASFAPEHTRHVVLGGARVGFVSVGPIPEGLTLEHLYVRPRDQRKGIGAAVLARIFAEADAAGLSLRVGALRESESNAFYVRHGFVFVEAGAWDNYYVRPATSSGRSNS
jgi:GNAT superfamily N-acetyltransferase